MNSTPAISADVDPDPTSQIPWPQRHRSGTQSLEINKGSVLPSRGSSAGAYIPEQQEITSGDGRLTFLSLFNLTVSMAGVQIAWAVELGYGTPFLLSLGLSEELTSLVWLAGPISGLIAQPLIGAISDTSRSRYRRRYWIITSTIVLTASMLALAYCQDIAAFLVDILNQGVGDWDPDRTRLVSKTSINIAVISFYLLDFSLNALQASLRNILLDVTPPDQLNTGNAWHGRMMHAGNIVGYMFGFLPLAELPILRLIGGSQFTKFCIVAVLLLLLTVSITCITQDEKTDFDEVESSYSALLKNIWREIVHLPKPIQKVCFVQIFAYMGWFPFLFYATTYIGQVMAQQDNAEPDPELIARTGYFALLLYSIVAVIAGTILPYLTIQEDERATNTTSHETDHSGVHSQSITVIPSRMSLFHWTPFLLRDIWCAAMILFTILTYSTFYIKTVEQATIMITLIGICWAVACWVPFAIIMAFLRDGYAECVTHNHRDIGSSVTYDEHSSLIERAQEEQQILVKSESAAGGTILGIHNLAVVLPQFFVAVIASAIFNLVDSQKDTDAGNMYLGKNGVAWVLRFGGACTLIGAFFARSVPPTRLEEIHVLRNRRQER